MIAFRLELRRTRALLVWTAVLLAGYGVVMGLMYPIMRENDDLLTQYMDVFPKEFLAIFGMTGLLSDPGVFYTTYIASWLWPIVAAIAGLLAGTRVVAADLERGFLDLPLATPLSRTRYLAASIGVQALLMAVLALAATTSVWVTVRAVGGDFDPVGYALAGVLSFAFGCAVAGPATLLSVVTLSRGTTSAIVGGVLVAMYAVFVVTQVATDWDWLAPLSAWDHFRTTDVIDDRTIPAFDLALFGAIAIGSWIASLWAFRRRDLAA